MVLFWGGTAWTALPKTVSGRISRPSGWTTGRLVSWMSSRQSVSGAVGAGELAAGAPPLTRVTAPNRFGCHCHGGRLRDGLRNCGQRCENQSQRRRCLVKPRTKFSVTASRTISDFPHSADHTLTTHARGENRGGEIDCDNCPSTFIREKFRALPEPLISRALNPILASRFGRLRSLGGGLFSGTLQVNLYSFDFFKGKGSHGPTRQF